MLRFDDSFQDQWAYAVPLLQRYHYSATFCVITGALSNSGIQSTVGDGGFQYMSWQEVQSLYSQGFFVVDHSMTHPDMNHLSLSNLNTQVVSSESMLKQNGITYPQYETDFCLPDGAGINNQSLLYYIWQTGGLAHTYSGYLYSPTGITDYNGITTEWVEVDAGSSQSLSTFEYYVNQASSNLAVGILFHHVNDQVCCGTTFYDNVTNFQQDLQYLSSNGFNVIIPPELPTYNIVIAPTPATFSTSQGSSTTTSSSTTTVTLTPSTTSSTSSSTAFTTLTTTLTSQPLVTQEETTSTATSTAAFIGTTSIGHSQVSATSQAGSTSQSTKSTTGEPAISASSSARSSSSTLSPGSATSYSGGRGSSSTNAGTLTNHGSSSVSSGLSSSSSSASASGSHAGSITKGNGSPGAGNNISSSPPEGNLSFLQEAAIGWSVLVLSIVPLIIARRRRELRAKTAEG